MASATATATRAHRPTDGEQRAAAAERARPRRRSWWRALASPLTRRVLTVNLIPPLLLAGGVLYLDHYRQGLVESALASLGTQAEMLAAAIGEGAVVEDGIAQYSLAREPALHMVRRLAEPAHLHARLYDQDGTLLADSHFLGGGPGAVTVEYLPPPQDTPDPTAWVRRAYDAVVSWLAAIEDAYPAWPRAAGARADAFSEAVAALDGEAGSAVRKLPDGTVVLSVAAPVQRYKKVVGAVMVSREGKDIAQSLFEVRIAILQMFLLALMVTVPLSVYLAGTIARPVRVLARAAERVRHGHGRAVRIPDLARRGDEIGELAAALRDMTEALWRRMDAIEAFAADVAHEIKNPLSSLRSAVETAARVQDPEQQRKLMAIIVDDVQRLDRLISDISDASRLDAELSRAESEPVRLRPMLATLAELHGSTDAEAKGVTLRLEADPGDELEISGIEGRLVQVFRNLIANAVSFSPAGGIVRIAARREAGGWIVVTVEDEGPGIPPGKTEAIFERFYSERPSGEKFGTHSGLGLSISRQIVEAHGGGISAGNRPEGGARFTVRLPAERPD